MATFRQLLWKAQGGSCWICRQGMRQGGNNPTSATLDHLWPKSVYGHIGDFGLCLLAHAKCNANRGNKRPTDADVRRLVEVYRKIPVTELLAELRTLEAAIAAEKATRLRKAIIEQFVWSKPARAA
jgi:5-methylcytosine-specific restriction endonuclease McrA